MAHRLALGIDHQRTGRDCRRIKIGQQCPGGEAAEADEHRQRASDDGSPQPRWRFHRLAFQHLIPGLHLAVPVRRQHLRAPGRDAALGRVGRARGRALHVIRLAHAHLLR